MNPFKNKIWLSSPTMHGDELKYMKDAYDTNWMSTVGANINEVERITCEKTGYQLTISLPPNFGKMIDIDGNQKIKNSPAYEQWAKIHNLQIQAEQFAYLSEQGLLQGDFLEQNYQKVSEEYEKVHGELKSLEADLKDLNLQLRLLGQYYSTRKEWKIYNKNGREEEYYLEHKTAIDLHEKVLGQLEEMYEGKKFPDVKWLKSRKGELIRKTKGLTQMSKKYKKYLDAFQSLTEFYVESGEKMYNKKRKHGKIYNLDCYFCKIL